MLPVVDGPLNCSLYNPCGDHGYCEDNTYGEWTCACKFWWNGSRCEYQTTSGKQVIALGCLVGVFIIVFHGLELFYYIRNKKREKKEAEKKELKDPTLFELAVTNVKQSISWTSCLVGMLVMSITALALTIKWTVLHPIHDELVYKFRNNISLYYQPNPICHLMNSQDYNLLTFPFACLLILIFIIRTKRLSFLPKFCHGYGALPMPVDFLSYMDRKFVAVVFAIYADELFDIVKNIVNGETKKVEGIMLVYLSRVADVLIISVRYYPILAAVYIKSIFTLTCATLYAWLDLSLTIIDQGMCDTDYYPTGDKYNETNEGNQLIDTFNYFGTGSTLMIIELCTDIPRYLCVAYVSVKLPAMLMNKIYCRVKFETFSRDKQIRMKSSREERVLLRTSDSNSSEMMYIRNLFRGGNQRPTSRCLIGRLIPKMIYEWRDDFHYSSRILGLYSSISLLLFFIIVEVCIRILPRLEVFRIYLQDFSDDFLKARDIEDNTETPSKYRIPNLLRLYMLVLVTTVIIIIIQLLVSLVNIRRNLFQLYRGEDCEIPRRQRSQYVSYSVNNVHFAGYFIGYLIWGIFLVALLSILIYGAIEAIIIYGNRRLVETAVKYSIPSSLLLYFKQYLNKFLSQYLFLQDRGQSVSIHHRRLLMIYIYLSFFLDAFLGVISSILRLTKSVIAGIVYMCRMDYSLLGRKLETFDGGFNAYCGFIHVECAHRHPIMLVFVSHLISQGKFRKYQSKDFDDKKKRSLRAIRKWQLGVFLCRNPTIVFFRKTYLNQLNIEEIRALNDIDDDQNTNLNKRLSLYTRRMSVWRPSIVSMNDSMHPGEARF